ncbi:hypothetical protein TNCV_2774691 [Trichonephila clavipes]|nr:hypothetical protein TNCV_2774691 [Trichonephila clavipes]
MTQSQSIKEERAAAERKLHRGVEIAPGNRAAPAWPQGLVLRRTLLTDNLLRMACSKTFPSRRGGRLLNFRFE